MSPEHELFCVPIRQQLYSFDHPQKLTMMAMAISTIRINPRILPPKGCDLANVSTKSVSLLSPNPRQTPSQRSALNSNRIMTAKNRLTTLPARFGISSRQNCFFSRSASLSRSSSSSACASLTALLRRSMSASNCCLTPPRLAGWPALVVGHLAVPKSC